MPAIDRTPKLFIGGKQARPDSGYSRRRARCRRAGASARSATAIARTSATPSRPRTRPRGWAKLSGHQRAQILYYIAENLSARHDEFAARIASHDRQIARAADAARSTRRSRACSRYAAWADKHDGAVHDVPMRGVALAMHEPIGVVGVACPDPYPLLGLVSLVAPLLATGQSRRRDPVRAIPARGHGLLQRARDVRRARRAS